MANDSTRKPASFTADSLATGMLMVLAMTIVQRGLGFLRGIWFCRLMDDTVVGGWAMAFDFITMITPVMLLGIPGSLPRYVEMYRQQGHLRQFVTRLLACTLICGVFFLIAMFAFPDRFGWLIFLQSESHSLVYSVAVGVLAIIAFNFVHQLVSSLRQIRTGSLMQFLQSVLFTVIGLGWMLQGGTLEGLILCFASATLIAIIPGAWVLGRGWSGLSVSEMPFDAAVMWRRLLPYAAALWVMNLLSNLFEMSDRYMILHFIGGGEAAGQAAVGQYHSGRIFPVLLMSLATMISGVLLPYLAADWESGRRDAVTDQMRKILSAVSVSFTLVSASVLMIAPWLFTNLLQNRYADGLALMPLAFVFYIWCSLAIIGQDYLWVCERGKWVGVAIAIGLAVNVVANLMLLPIWGLHGAVVATFLAHAVVLGGVWIAMVRCGFRFDMSMLLITILPATLLWGVLPAFLCSGAVVLGSDQIKGWIREGQSAVAMRLSARRGCFTNA